MKRLLEAKADFDRMVNILIDYDLIDSDKAILLVNKFKDFRNRNLIKGRDRDISTWYRRPVEFIYFIEDLENKKSKTELAKLAKEGAELVARNNEWKVYRIETHTASCFYGKGTKWCTAGKNPEYFDSYKDRGVVLYYVISDNKKYAIALYPEIVSTLKKYGVKANFELFDEEDNLIIDKEELENILNKFPKIPYAGLILEFLPAEIWNKVLIRVYPYNSGEFIIPDGITSIASYAFDGCSSLTSITIPNSVTSIGSYVFRGCSSLTNITIPDSVTSIGNGVFGDCSSLTSVTIPDSVTSIGSYVFHGCSSLTNITISDSVTSIGNGVFGNCSSLTSITIPKSVTSIGDYAFLNCSALTLITIPNSVTSIGGSAFFNCSSLTSITIPKNVTSIEDYTFLNCSALTSINIPSRVTSIGDYAFHGCSSLTSITIPKSVISIGDYAFYGCYNLTIYAEAESKPENWRQAWAPDDMPVIWGYKQTKNLKEGMTMRGSRFLKESMKLTVFEIETKIINFFKEKGITVTVSREEDAFKVFLPRHINVKKQANIIEELRKLINELFSQDNMSAIVDETPFGFIIHPTLGIHNFKLFEDKRVSGKDKKKCAICKAPIDGPGNDPWPIDVGITSRVCDACNFEFVIPARLNLLKNKKKIKEASNPTKHEIEKEASNIVLDNKFIWLFSVLSEDGIDIEEGIEYLNDAIDVLINKNGTYLVAFPYVDPNPEDLSVDLVFADNPGPVIIYNREEATVPKDKLHKPTNIKQPKDNLTQEGE